MQGFKEKILTKLPAAGGSAAWGGITGTLSAQTDLQAALDAKQGNSITYLQTSFTIATGSYKALPEVQLLSTNRITIEGTGRLRINN